MAHMSLLEWIAQNYQWKLSLLAGLGTTLAALAIALLAKPFPVFRATQQLNKDTMQQKMQKPHYAANQLWNRKWSAANLVVIFGMILPFCLTSGMPNVGRLLIDVAVILMVYDFFYYLTHRFVFHQKPLLWMHAVHHQQHNPCRADSSYIHPLEVAIGLGLYVSTIAILSAIMGKFDVVTIVVTFTAFSQINLHNHNRWEDPGRFPYRYLTTMSVMHHNHHAKFTGGNFATITLLYDWMFGTLDYGDKRGVAPAR